MTHTHDMFFCFDEKYVKFDTKYGMPTFVHKKNGKNLSLGGNLKLKYYSNFLGVRDVGDFLGLKKF